MNTLKAKKMEVVAEIFNMEPEYLKKKKAYITKCLESLQTKNLELTITEEIDAALEKNPAFSDKTRDDYRDIKTKIMQSQQQKDGNFKLLSEERLFSSAQNKFRIYLEYAVATGSEEIVKRKDENF